MTECQRPRRSVSERDSNKLKPSHSDARRRYSPRPEAVPGRKDRRTRAGPASEPCIVISDPPAFSAASQRRAPPLGTLSPGTPMPASAAPPGLSASDQKSESRPPRPTAATPWPPPSAAVGSLLLFWGTGSAQLSSASSSLSWQRSPPCETTSRQPAAAGGRRALTWIKRCETVFSLAVCGGIVIAGSVIGAGGFDRRGSRRLRPRGRPGAAAGNHVNRRPYRYFFFLRQRPTIIASDDPAPVIPLVVRGPDEAPCWLRSPGRSWG